MPRARRKVDTTTSDFRRSARKRNTATRNKITDCYEPLEKRSPFRELSQAMLPFGRSFVAWQKSQADLTVKFLCAGEAEARVRESIC